VAEAERFKADDEANRSKVEAKNGLENYAFNVRNSINDDKVKAKLSAEDRATVESAVEEALRWLEDHHEALEEEYKEQQKALEGKVRARTAPAGRAARRAACPASGGGRADLSAAAATGACVVLGCVRHCAAARPPARSPPALVPVPHPLPRSPPLSARPPHPCRSCPS
jgi:heat shock protein 1/8